MFRRRLTSWSLPVVLVSLLVYAACSDHGPTDPADDPPMATLRLLANVQGVDVQALVVEVTGADIAEPLIFNIPVVENVDRIPCSPLAFLLLPKW